MTDDLQLKTDRRFHLKGWLNRKAASTQKGK